MNTNAENETFAADPTHIGDALLIDVRRAPVFDQASSMLPGASWADPALVSEWVTTLPSGREVIVYCVYGHEVSQNAAMHLRAAGVNARFLAGGIDGWQKAGLAVQTKG